MALKSNVPTITFDTSNLKGNYKSKINQIMGDVGLTEFYNSYLNDISKETVLEQIDNIICSHDIISETIEMNMRIEAQKSESFFERITKSL